jgi:hypothetical protein
MHAMSRKNKPRKCRICKKRPVWRGGDVKNPGPVCKKCYHKHVWPDRRAAMYSGPLDDEYDPGLLRLYSAFEPWQPFVPPDRSWLARSLDEVDHPLEHRSLLDPEHIGDFPFEEETDDDDDMIPF